MNFQNKVVLITGSGSGIGQATAILFAKEGADIVIVECNEEGAKKTAEKCKEFGRKVLVIKADISINAEAKNAIDKTINDFGKLDVLVNNAGIIRKEGIISGDIMDTYDIVMNVNLRAVVHLTTLAAPHLIKTKGCVINVSSKSTTLMSYARQFPAYAMSKAGVDCFTRISALEFASSGVRVNAVCCGPVYTNIMASLRSTPQKPDGEKRNTISTIALGKGADPKEIADLIVYLASDKAKSVTGSIYDIDNGMGLG